MMDNELQDTDKRRQVAESGGASHPLRRCGVLLAFLRPFNGG